MIQVYIVSIQSYRNRKHVSCLLLWRFFKVRISRIILHCYPGIAYGNQAIRYEMYRISIESASITDIAYSGAWTKNLPSRACIHRNSCE
jgi:hypothetical protein